MVGSAVIRYRRELRLMQRFTLETRIAAWSDTTAVMEQTFLVADGPQKGQMAARALVQAGFYGRKDRSFVTVKRLIAELGLPDEETESPPLTPEIEAFLKAETLLRPQVGGDARAPRGSDGNACRFGSGRYLTSGSVKTSAVGRAGSRPRRSCLSKASAVERRILARWVELPVLAIVDNALRAFRAPPAVSMYRRRLFESAESSPMRRRNSSQSSYIN